MRRFVEEADCGQWTLLPECLDDFIDESNSDRSSGKQAFIGGASPTSPCRAHQTTNLGVRSSNLFGRAST